MSDLRRDIDEEDELRHLLSRPERGLVTPPFAALRARHAGRGVPQGLTAAAAVAVVLLAMAIAPAALRPGSPTATRSPSPAPTAVAVAVPPGATPASVTPCPEIAMPAYLPTQAGYVTRSGRTASSEDIVTLTVPELQVNGQPAELTVVAEAVRPLWMITREGTRQIGPQGQRTVTLVFTGGLSATPAPGLTPSIDVRSEMRAEWYEPNGTCQYFTAKLLSSGTDARAMETELIRIIESMPLTAALASPSPAPTWTVARLLPEQEAWDRIRAMFPSGPVARPTWLPPEVDRRGVELRTLEVTPTRVYEVVYFDATGPIITFRLGPVEALRESGMGFCCVRSARATLQFATYLFNDPARPGVRRMQWEEQTRTLTFTSQRIKGEDMLRIAWEMDRTTAPPNPYPNVRAKRGACASSASAEDTIRRMLALYGSKDRDALLDCMALDRIVSEGTGSANAVDLPTTGGVTTRKQSEVAGRVLVSASWTFSSDPGGPFSRQPTQFFLLGLEDGAWRIYDAGTAPFGTPP